MRAWDIQPLYLNKYTTMDKRTLIIAASFLGLSLAMFFLMAAVIKNFLATKKKVFIYAVITLVAFSLVALLGYQGLISGPGIQLLVFQLCLFGLGMVHAGTLYQYMDWEQKDAFHPDIMFSLFIWLAGLIPFYVIYSLISGTPGYPYHMLGTSLFFIVPILFRKTFVAARAVPLPEMEQWYYPVHTSVPDPEAHELENPFVITFVVRKKAEDPEPASFRAKAPAEMKLGRLFYYFVEDYNEQHSGDLLEYSDQFGRPYGWVFYFKPRWYLFFSKRYRDPAQTVKENNIGENTVIICERADILDEEVKALEGEVFTY